MCRVLGVSRSGYYAWKSRTPSRRRRDDLMLLGTIREIHSASKKSYGSPRIYRELKARGFSYGRGRIARVMRLAHLRGIAARRRKPRLPKVERGQLPNHLQRRFQVGRLNQHWAADFTYIRTSEGWLFLAVVMDIGSRRVIGWAMRSRPDAELVLNALEMALHSRVRTESVVHHSDRGIHYTSSRYRALMSEANLTASYSGLGDCWDNAVVESFFHSLKTEEVHGSRYRTRAEAKRRLFEYIEVWYNRKRRHSAIGFVSPAEYECRL
jgi:putative transposase